MKTTVEQMTAADWPEVATIHREGISTGHATFTRAPAESFAEFSVGKQMDCAIVAREEGQKILGWATLTKVSDRCVYDGVAEVSVYVAAVAHGKGIGSALLRELIRTSEAAGIWTLQAGIFPENTASIALHENHGFRLVGQRTRIGKMTFGPFAGKWRDTLLLERRSSVVGCE
jgi:L-amino acid N-acyltransferase YncA